MHSIDHQSQTFIGLPDVARRMGVTARTLAERSSAGLFVAPIKTSTRKQSVLESEVNAIQGAYFAGADDEAIKALVCRLHARRQELAEKYALEAH